jgi:two-component system sensor histidine kinase KdpD
MTDDRPDPDALLARVQAEEAKQARGKLKIFFGAAPGVGKTYAMLEAGRKVAKEGVNVLVGYIEPHVRPDTAALVLGLDLLARREIPYRGTMLWEFDLEGALAQKPTLILVDELAHTNAHGVTHAKRWQDIEKLLDAGIDVYTTLNVQHLESLNDIVAQITTVRVRETVPDAVFEQADEVELVDLPPDDLIDRLHEGKVYVPQQAQRAIEHFFRKGNLIALRELALRMMTQRVGAQVQDWRQRNAERRMWPTGERFLVCVGPSPLSARLIRAARRMASILQAQWYAVYVENTARPLLRGDDRQRLAQNLHLAEQLGANVITLSGPDFADEVFRFAYETNVSRIVVGKPHDPPWRMWLRRSYVHELIQKSGDIDVYVISGDEEKPLPRVRPTREQPAIWSYVWSTVIVLGCTVLGILLYPHFSALNIAMVYMAAIVGISLGLGRGPSVLASILGVALFDFCFIPPRWTFAIADTEYIFTFFVMLTTGLVISTLTERVKQQAESARQRERRTRALYQFSRELAALPTREAITQAACRQIAAATDSKAAILLPLDGRLAAGEGAAGFEPDKEGRGVAQWVFEHREPAGRGTDTLPGGEALYLPLNVAGGIVGVLGILPGHAERLIEPEQFHLLDALAGQLALAIERADLAREAELIRLQMETERLRNSLLSAISHDLRTPLATITGASSTLMDPQLGLGDEARRELAESIFDESERLNRLVNNLLDMTRLEAGAIRVRKELQPLDEVVGVVLERLERQLRGHPVTTRLPAELPPVPIDGLLIQQVLTNLLDNAAKYAPAGTPIELSASASGTALTVEVADRGQGIKPGEEERIFDKFFRSGHVGSGAGLGLPICRGIIELHGGKIWAENRPEGGAVFRFTLPLRAGAPAKTSSPPFVLAGDSPP